ncbi:hypothetical protein KEM52_000474 [Ascosphaera acerosa]|nr:hypothetical protein KEM52_000474 [Ascosphaera acerosa]
MGPRSPSLAGTTENSRTSPPPDRTASSDTSRAQRLRRPRPPLAERTLPRIWEDDFRELDPDLAPPSPTLPWPLVKNIPEVYDVFGAEYVAIMRARHPDLYYDPQIHRGHDHDLQSENDSESDGAAAVPGPLDAARAKPARTPASSSDGRQGQERPGARHRGEGTDGKAVVAASLSGKAQPALPRHPQEGRRSNATASAAGGVRNGGIGAKARPEQHQMAAPASTSASTSTSTSRRPSNSLQTPRLIVKLRYGRAKARQVRTILAGLPVVAARKRPISLVPDTRAKRSPSTTGATGLASSARRAGTPTRSSVSSTTGAAGVRSGITSGARSTASRNVSNSSAASDSSVMKRSASSPQGRRSSRSRPGNAAASSTSEAASVQDDAATTQQWEAESLHFWQLARELRQDCRQCPDEAFAVVLGLESLLASAMYCTIQEKLQQQQGAMTNPDLWEKNFLSLWREIRAKALKHETLQGLRLMLGAIVLGVVHEREMENAVEEGRQDPRLGRSNANGPDGNGSGNAEASRNGNGNGTGHRNGNGDGNQSDHSESSILEAEAKADRYYQTCDKALATYRRARQLWCMSEELLPRQEMEENFPDTWSKCHARTARQHKSKLTAPESYDWDDLVPISLVSTPLETVRFVYACLSEWAGEHQPTWKGQLHRKSG